MHPATLVSLLILTGAASISFEGSNILNVKNSRLPKFARQDLAEAQTTTPLPKVIQRQAAESTPRTTDNFAASKVIPPPEDRLLTNVVEEHQGNGAYFQQLGAMTRSTDYGHFRLQINLQHLRHNMSITCKSTEHFIAKAIEGLKDTPEPMVETYYGPRKVKNLQNSANFLQAMLAASRGVERQCKQLLADFDDVVAIYLRPQDENRQERNSNGVTTVRNKRQLFIGILIGLGVAAAISSIFSGHALASLTVGTGTTNHAIEVMQDHETRLSVLESRFSHAENMLAKISNEAEHALALSLINEAVQQRDEMELNARRIMGGLEKLFSRRLSPTLVQTAFLPEALDRLNENGKTKGLQMVSNNPTEVFTYETSHLIFNNGTMIVFVHVPMVPYDGFLNLFRYVGVPTKIKDSDVYCTAKPHKSLLAINSAETFFRVMDEEELRNCDRVGDVLFCHNANYLDKRVQDECLVALFQHEYSTVAEKCRMIVEPDRDIVVPMNASTYIVYQASNSPVSLQCGSGTPERTQSYNGTIRITVPDGCMVSTRSFVLEGTVELDVPTLMPGIDLLDFDPILSEEEMDIIKTGVADLAQEFAGMTGKQEIDIKDLLPGFRKERASHRITMGLMTGLGIVLVFVIVLCMLRFRVCAKRARQRGEKEKAQNRANEAAQGYFFHNNPPANWWKRGPGGRDWTEIVGFSKKKNDPRSPTGIEDDTEMEEVQLQFQQKSANNKIYKGSSAPSSNNR